MSLSGKLETDVELKASAQQFHEEGSVIICNYVHDGKAKVSKEQVEKIDPVKNLVTYKVIEGDLLNEYKSFKIIVQVTPKGTSSVSHWTDEYEKQHPGISHLETLLQFAAELSKEIDSHLTSAK
ncbi:hypothetical protein SLA2020_399730 [Shorea laevis]